MNKSILILGGGTAGWMSATLLKKHLPKHEVTLVESPNIGTIGVGEGSTPHLKQFFDALDISEYDWMPACNATFKNGISFINWTEHLKNNRYFHPFPSIIDRQTAGAFLSHCILRHKGLSLSTNPDDFFLAYELSKQQLSPKTQANKPKIPMNYAYHFDSNLLGQYLCNLGKKMGVKHVQGDLAKVELHDASDEKTGNIKTPMQSIKAIHLKDKQKLCADFFIDASGFASLLVQRALNTNFESFSSNLFNDSAVAVQSASISPLSSETKATALKNGWAWHIPLTNRTGNGYVYASQYTTSESAKQELLKHLNLDQNTECRQIKMKVGQVENAWVGNTLAIGLAQGFIEPLEATALHLVLETLTAFLREYKQGNFDESNVTGFNNEIRLRYEGIRDYIVCHYKVNSRSDSQYWLDCAAQTDISENLAAVLAVWDAGKDITPILNERKMTQYYPAMSWYCLLAGYGRFKTANTSISSDPNIQSQFTKMRQYLQKTADQFTQHETSLSSL